MEQDTVVSISSQNAATDQLTVRLRERAGELLVMAVDAYVKNLLAGYADLRNPSGNPGRVLNGYLPECETLTGIGLVPVKVPRVRERTDSAIGFESALYRPTCSTICLTACSPRPPDVWPRAGTNYYFFYNIISLLQVYELLITSI